MRVQIEALNRETLDVCREGQRGPGGLILNCRSFFAR